MMGRRKNTF